MQGNVSKASPPIKPLNNSHFNANVSANKSGYHLEPATAPHHGSRPPGLALPLSLDRRRGGPNDSSETLCSTLPTGILLQINLLDHSFHRSPSAWRRVFALTPEAEGTEPEPPCRPSTNPARLRNGLRRSRGIRKVDVDCRLVPKGTSEHLTRAFNYAGRGVRAPEVRGGPYGCVSDR